MATRSLAFVCLSLAVLLGSLSVIGCSPQTDSTTLVIPIRDDCAPADTQAIQSMLLSDQRVASCDYVSENVTLTEGASAAATLTAGPDGDPWQESWFEVVVPTDSLEVVLESMESHPAFGRVVRVPDRGDWWQVR